MMKLKQFFPFSALVCSFFAVTVQADTAPNEAITKQLAKFDIQVDEIQPSAIPNLFEVQTQSGILYTNSDASYFLYGKLFATKNNQLVDLTEKTEAKRNLALFKKANVEKELISYPAKKEQYVINVFTDTTCGYCVKLHSQIKQYNDLGITVRYLAFPRGGERSPNLGQMSAIWCSKDKQGSMDLAKTGSYKESNSTCMNMVRHHYELGTQIGITGTPAIMLADGSLISGYVPPEQLIKRLKQQS